MNLLRYCDLKNGDIFNHPIWGMSQRLISNSHDCCFEFNWNETYSEDDLNLIVELIH